MSTHKLFWDDCYQKNFTGSIIDILDEGVVLDQTCFYPQGGGQSGDVGFLNNVPVLDTKPINGMIVHVVENKHNFSLDMQVNGSIDWERRYRLMRLHSLSHIMEYFLFKRFGKLNLVSSFISETKDKSTYETNIQIDNEKLKPVEEDVNNFVSENHDIILYYDNIDLSVRYWECNNIKIPCGGTHPQNTSEIGRVRIYRKSGGKGKQLILSTIDGL